MTTEWRYQRPGQPPDVSDGGGHSASTTPPASAPVKLVYAGPSVATLSRRCPTCEEIRTMTVVGNDDHLWARCVCCEELWPLDIENIPGL